MTKKLKKFTAEKIPYLFSSLHEGLSINRKKRTSSNFKT
jgi:hypothetical protein